MCEHYLDNSATTRCSDSAAKTVMHLLTTEYGNPSSLHKKGLSAELEINKAKSIICNSLSVEEEQIYFTSGSTESNNLVLFGVAAAKRRISNKIVTTAIEHSSVLEACKKLEQDGFEVVYLSPDSNGVVDIISFEQAIDENTILVSCMMVNNETGAIQPVDKIASIIKRKAPNAYFHCDAVQAYGKLPLKPKKWGVDLMSVSSHKVHGPKGVGALYVAQNVRLVPSLYGGEQQKKLRPGTQAAPNIAGFGTAVDEFDIINNYAHVQELNSYLRDKLSAIPDISFNNNENALPYILNISVKGIKSETMLHHLEQDNVFVSSSSACAKGKKSYVLSAMNLDAKRIDTSLRISFSKYNTKEDVDAFVSSLKKGIDTLAKTN